MRLDPETVQTNIVVFDIADTGLTTAQFTLALKSDGVLANGISACEYFTDSEPFRCLSPILSYGLAVALGSVSVVRVLTAPTTLPHVQKHDSHHDIRPTSSFALAADAMTLVLTDE